MKIFSNKLNSKVGRPPGDLTYYGEGKRRDTKIRLIQYDKKDFEEKVITKENDLLEIKISDKNTWIDIEGFADTVIIKNLGRHFEIHDMVVEDAFHTDHIPKYEEGNRYLIFVLKSFYEDGNIIKASQVTLLMKNNLVISFQEEHNPIILTKIERIKNSIGRVRNKGIDYLFFVLIDAFIDSYYTYFENLREEINSLDTRILLETSQNHIQQIYNLKNKLTSIRKNLFPLKTAINELLSDESNLIDENNTKYFNDCKDNINELIEFYHSFEETINNLISLNESNLANSTNKIMKVLTIIATIFIPLTFIAGVYGMNFENMPELKWEFGYYFSLPLMLLTGLTILGFIKWKKWF